MSPRKPKPSKSVFSDTEKAGKAAAARPTKAAILETFPEAVVTDYPDGKYNIHIEDHTPEKKRLRLLNEMFQQSERLEHDLGQELHDRAPKTKVKDNRGQTREVWEQHAETVDRRVGQRRLMVSGWRPPGDPRDGD